MTFWISGIKRTAQNLVDNARIFKKERWSNVAEREEPIGEQATPEHNNKQLNWTIEMKMDVVIMDKWERAKGRGFMKRVKERWDQKYPEHQQAGWQKLIDKESIIQERTWSNETYSSSAEKEKPQDQEQEEEQTDFESYLESS